MLNATVYESVVLWNFQSFNSNCNATPGARASFYKMPRYVHAKTTIPGHPTASLPHVVWGGSDQASINADPQNNFPAILNAPDTDAKIRPVSSMFNLRTCVETVSKTINWRWSALCPPDLGCHFDHIWNVPGIGVYRLKDDVAPSEAMDALLSDRVHLTYNLAWGILLTQIIRAAKGDEWFDEVFKNMLLAEQWTVNTVFAHMVCSTPKLSMPCKGEHKHRGPGHLSTWYGPLLWLLPTPGSLNRAKYAQHRMMSLDEDNVAVILSAADCDVMKHPDAVLVKIMTMGDFEKLMLLRTQFHMEQNGVKPSPPFSVTFKSGDAISTEYDPLLPVGAVQFEELCVIEPPEEELSEEEPPEEELSESEISEEELVVEPPSPDAAIEKAPIQTVIRTSSVPLSSMDGYSTTKLRKKGKKKQG